MTTKVEVRLLEMMGKRNIRQIKELHEMTGISRTVISNILNGDKQGLRLDTIAKLCYALDCRVDELIVIKEDDAS